jgi:phosphoserine phosphatase RsbU/P
VNKDDERRASPVGDRQVTRSEPGHHGARGESASSEDTISVEKKGLTRFIQLDTLQVLQDSFARLGQFSVCIADVNGQPITRPTWGSRYSELIGLSSRGRVEWHDGLAVMSRKPPPEGPVIILEGMTLYAAPVVYRRRRLAVIVVGTRPLELPGPDGLRELAKRFGVDPGQMVAAGKLEYPFTGGTPESIHRFADLLAETLATLYGQAETIGQQLADLRVVHGVAEMLAGTRDLQQMLDATVRRVVEVMPVKACGIRLLDEETGELIVKAVHNLSAEYLQKGPVKIQENAIDVAAFRGETVYIEDAPNDPRIRYRENARREGIVSGLCVPMTFRGRTIGVLRVYTGKRYKFSEAEQQLLKSIAAQAAAAVITSRYHEERVEAERVAQQVEAARQIQRRMLPSRSPQHATLDIAGVYDPSLQLGGDFFDFIEWPGGGICVVIADVVGKGLPAALMMTSIRASLRAHAATARDVADLVNRVNREVCRDTLSHEFATLYAALFSRDGRSCTYCNAGHVPAVLLRSQSVSRLNEGGGMAIGILPDESYEQAIISFKPDDIVVLMTDGVIEALDFHDATYGDIRAIRSIRRHQELPAKAMARQLLWDVRRFAGLAEQSDDITIVVVKSHS